MKKIYLLVLVLALLVCGCGGDSAPEATQPPTEPPPPAPTDTPAVGAGWQLFTSEAGSFAVRLPSTPQEQAQTSGTGETAIEMHMFMVSKGDTAGFAVMYSDMPAAIAEATPTEIEGLLDSGRDGALANMGGSLVREESVSLEGYPGRHIVFAIPEEQLPGGGEGVLRVYLVGARLYQLMAMGNTGKLSQDEVDHFLDSFQLLETPESVPVGFTTPESVLEAVFQAARSGDLSALQSLCDPLGENDDDTQMICDADASEENREMFLEYFRNGRISGPSEISPDGNTADVPFLFGPDGDQEEMMVLIKRDGRWYLLEF